MRITRRGIRALLAAGIALGLANLLTLPLFRPEQLGLASRVYTRAAEAALAGDPFYGLAPAGLEGYHFVYQPVVVIAFLPFGLVGDPLVAFLVLTGVSVAAGVGIARLVVRALERAGVAVTRLDRGLLAGFCLLSTHTAPTLVNGQVNLLLGLALAAGLVAAERGRPVGGGAALALPATVKLFPATIGASLVRRRQWRTLAAALATGLGLLAVGLVAFGPDATVTYLTTVLPGEAHAGALARNPLDHGFLTVRRQLAALVPWLPADWLPAAAVAVVAPVVAVTYRRLDGRLDRWLAVLATLAGTLLVLPLEALYFPILFFPLLPLLYALPAGPTRTLLVAGTALTLLGLTPSSLDALAASGLVGPDGMAVVRAIVEPVYRVILPGTLGMWLWLAAGVHWQRRGRTQVAVGAADASGG